MEPGNNPTDMMQWLLRNIQESQEALVQRMEQSQTDLRTELQNQMEQLQLQTMSQSTQDTTQSAQVQTPTATTSIAPNVAPIEEATPFARRPRPSIPDPMRFAGSTSEWPAWKVTMLNKLAIDQDAIGPLRNQFFYVFSRLEGLAARNSATFVDSRRDDLSVGPNTLLDYLERLYGDPNAQARAAARLHQLKQKEGQSFSRFLPSLEKELADSGAMAWPDEAKRQIVLASLNSTMQENLLNRGIPSSYSELIARLHAISSDRDLFAAKRNSTKTVNQLPRTQPRNSKPATPVYKADPMDWTPTQTIALNNTRAARPRKDDKDLIGKRAQWVSQAEFEARRDAGVCIRCAREGCYSGRCPLKPAINPKRTPRTQANNAKAHTPTPTQGNPTRVEDVLSTDESASEGSGKE
jgi:hypothetical protein